MLRNSVMMILALCGAACAAETPGKTVQVVWQLDQHASGTFETEAGFQVQLEEARLGLAAAYVYAPLSDSTQAVSWRWLTGVSVAHAHGGLDPETGRKVLAEQLEPVTLDLLDTRAQTLLPMAAEAGSVDAVKLELAQSGATGSEVLHGGCAYLRGTAQREETRVTFAASVVLDSAIKARSIDLSGVRGSVAEGAVLHVRVDPAVWLRSAEFDRLPRADADAEVAVSADSQVGRALVIGVRSPEAYALEITAEREAPP